MIECRAVSLSEAVRKWKHGSQSGKYLPRPERPKDGAQRSWPLNQKARRT